jgi:hypothetical protein
VNDMSWSVRTVVRRSVGVCVGGRGSERLSLSDTCAVTKPTSEYARVSGGVGGDFVPARPSSCTLTSIDQRRAREAYSERQVLKGTHSGAEGSGRVVVVRGGGVSEGQRSHVECAVARPFEINVVNSQNQVLNSSTFLRFYSTLYRSKCPEQITVVTISIVRQCT